MYWLLEYADDMAILCDCEEDLELATKIIEVKTSKKDFKLNKAKCGIFIFENNKDNIMSTIGTK